MVRLFFLALASMVVLSCAPSPMDAVVLLVDTPEQEFADAVDEYLAKHEDVLAMHNFAAGERHWSRLSYELFRSMQAWEWLEKYNDFGNVQLKPGTRLEDLSEGAQDALQDFLDWDPYLVVKETERDLFSDSVGSVEFLSILLDLLGGDHPIWGQYVTLLSLGEPPSFAWLELMEFISEHPDALSADLVLRVKESVMTNRWLIPDTLSWMVIDDVIRQHNPNSDFIYGKGEGGHELGYYLMSFDPLEELSLNDPRLEDWRRRNMQILLEEKAAQLP